MCINGGGQSSGAAMLSVGAGRLGAEQGVFDESR